MEAFNQLISKLSSIVWGPPMLALIVLTGIVLTYKLRFIQISKLTTGLRFAFGKKGRSSSREGDVSPFQSLMTALAATIGTGNIVGVATAISIGGPGALFWMWVIAFLGMATKYSEALLAVKYRIKDENGKMNGGPMYYIERGMGKKWKPLAIAFAAFGSIAAFGIGNMVQANAVAGNVIALMGAEGESAKTAALITGLVLALFTGVVILGGIKSIGRTAAVMVPFMATFY
ncbi:MAG: alanine:cation symporter family protein, partial [Verrucomicrobiota bacterium]